MGLVPPTSPSAPETSREPVPPRPVTVQDLARAAGVAASTVSRSFTHPQRVNARTREHVLAVAERLGYRSSSESRSAASRGTGTLALLVPDITNPSFLGLIRGAERHASAAGFTLLLVSCEETADLEARHIERLGGTVDAFVLASSRLPDERIRQIAAAHRCTLVNREVEGVASVTVDNETGTRQIVEHLASLGHRSVTYLAGPRNSWMDARRWQAIEATARTLGLTPSRLGPFPPSVAGGAAAGDAAIGHRATAVVAFNDLLAIGVLGRLAERGIAVPRDISVVGYDDIFGADFCSPPLTTLAAPIEDAGRIAITLSLRGPDTGSVATAPHRAQLSPLLRIRASSGPAPLITAAPADG